MLALIAGRGRLPAALVAALPSPPLVASPEGFDPDGLAPDRRFRLEHLGTLIADLKGQGVTEVCFAGAVQRPSVDPTLIDAATMPLFPRIAQALQRGDDGALRVLLEIFEEAGLAVRAAHDLAPELLPGAGTPTARQPEERHSRDAERAAAVIAGLGPLDVGQGCVVRAEQVLAIEGAFGTDWMLDSLDRRPDGAGGLFYKAKKPGQNLRVDLPVIGVDTVARAAKAGLEGIAIEAGGVMVLDIAGVTRAADAAGLFLWVREP